MSILKCGLVFRKFFNLGIVTTFMENFGEIERSDTIFVPISFFPATIYFIPYTGYKYGILRYPIIYSYLKIAPFLFEDVKIYYKLVIGFNLFVFNIEGGFCHISYYTPIWSKEMDRGFYITGIISLGL